jgi:hypothetical protein
MFYEDQTTIYSEDEDYAPRWQLFYNGIMNSETLHPRCIFGIQAILLRREKQSTVATTAEWLHTFIPNNFPAAEDKLKISKLKIDFPQ